MVFSPYPPRSSSGVDEANESDRMSERNPADNPGTLPRVKRLAAISAQGRRQLWSKMIVGCFALKSLSIGNLYRHCRYKQQEIRRAAVRGLPACAGSWGRFERGRTLLTGTQVIQRNHMSLRPKINASTIDTKAFDQFFFDPDANFAFCAIEKNACSQWQTVLRNVMDKRTSNGYRHPDYYIGENAKKRHGTEKLKQILEAPDSTVAVFVRDPLSRFASAYLDKCFAKNCSSDFCFPRFYQKPRGQDQLVPKGQPISFRHALDWIMRENVTSIDGHFSLQSNRCGMEDGGLENYFTVIGKMTKDTLPSDGDCIMKFANASQHNIPAAGAPRLPREGNGTVQPPTFWSPQGGKRGGIETITYREEDESDVLKRLFTKEAAQELMEKFRRDYDVFQLPEPEWVELATGEWMDSLDHHFCRVQKQPNQTT